LNILGLDRTLFICLCILTLVLIAATVPQLARYPPVSSDEGWILSASSKLAIEGVYGSDLYAGVFNAENHYFIALPGQHVLQAVAFRLLGVGIVQARLLSVLAGVVLLWTTGGLAWRWYGVTVAVLSGILLVFWRSQLIALRGGIPLLAVARSARYDLSAVAWMWLTMFFLYAHLEQPTQLRAVAVGFCAGAATLTQFFGAFVVPIVAVAWIYQRREQVLTDPHTYCMAASFLLLTGAYVLYVRAHWEDALGQLSYTKPGRAAFSDLSFWLDNLRRETHRYSSPWQQPGHGKWLLVATGPAVAHLIYRLVQENTPGDRLLALNLALNLMGLALVDATKAPLYALPLVPGVCMALALLMGHLGRWAWSRQAPVQRIAGLLALAVMGYFTWEGIQLYRDDLAAARLIPSYEEVGQTIAASIPPDARVAGAERWHWALRSHPYLALNGLWLQWQIQYDRSGEASRIGDVVREAGLQYILVNDNVRGDIRQYPNSLESQFWSYLETCTTLEDAWMFPGYWDIELHAVQPFCRDADLNHQD
jgi:4-amino-4-deoxy-L-arabinose transferase-like glycosyltransferase